MLEDLLVKYAWGTLIVSEKEGVEDTWKP